MIIKNCLKNFVNVGRFFVSECFLFDIIKLSVIFKKLLWFFMLIFFVWLFRGYVSL